MRYEGELLTRPKQARECFTNSSQVMFRLLISTLLIVSTIMVSYADASSAYQIASLRCNIRGILITFSMSASSTSISILISGRYCVSTLLLRTHKRYLLDTGILSILRCRAIVIALQLYSVQYVFRKYCCFDSRLIACEVLFITHTDIYAIMRQAAR